MIYPPDFTAPYAKLRRAHLAAHRIAALAPAHRAVVQAGGCVGLWPLALATYFRHVHTFEPAPTNAACLAANIAGVPSITAYPEALGAAQAAVGLTRRKATAGLWRVDGAGEIPMVTLDERCATAPIDALVLDVEGMELDVWRGAARLIARWRPLLWFEYLTAQPDLLAWLAAQGYTEPQPGMAGDCYSVHRGGRDA